MDKSIFIRADELAVELDVSKALAYKMINQWNEELKAKGYTTVGGRVSRNSIVSIYAPFLQCVFL